jgi:CheY-like chemotaxis protein
MLSEERAETKISVSLRDDVEILIVEDEPGHYKLIEHCLRNAGVENEIAWFEDGKSVLDFLYGDGSASGKGKKYIMLLDIRMPGVDGIEVLKKIKQEEKWDHIQVIMLTTSDDQHQARLCYDLGCEAHIVKPPGKSLLAAIDRIVLRL